MSALQQLIAKLDAFPRVLVTHAPTPLEPLANLGAELGLDLWVKRDDCTGLAFGGNKVRQLEFYLGEAVAGKADTILITGAVQSNFVRTAAAMARRFGMDCHVQLEERVSGVDDLYRRNGNVLLDRLLGATIHSYAVGEDESGADTALESIARGLRDEGRSPYVIPLGTDHPPTGALGYVTAAIEIAEQLAGQTMPDEIVVASGSAATHSGLLFGLRALGITTPVRGICVRRDAVSQTRRVTQRVEDIGRLMGMPLELRDGDIDLYDGTLAPGYGKLNDRTVDAIRRTARREGLFLDPAYTGKVMSGLIRLAEEKKLSGNRILFWHTGGQPGLFAYADQL